MINKCCDAALVLPQKFVFLKLKKQNLIPTFAFGIRLQSEKEKCGRTAA